MVRRPVIKSEHVLISWLDLFLTCQTPDLGRSSMVELADVSVEAANATKPGGQTNLIHWQAGLIDQFLGKMQSASLGYRHGSRSQMTQEQAAKMPRPYSQSLRQDFNSTISQPTLADQT